MNGISKPISREKKYSYEEASARARALDIRSSKEYRRRRKEDPRLPLNPHRCYAKCGWKRWGVFLDTDPYSYEEARKRVQELGIRTSKEYLIRYSEDRRLRSAPDDIYPKEWTCWGDFLGPIPTRTPVSEQPRKKKVVPVMLSVVKSIAFAPPVPLEEMPPVSERAPNRGWYGWDVVLGGVPK